MSRDFILQRITISISTLSKCVREKKQKTSFVPGGTATRYKCPLPRRSGDGTFVLGRGSTRYKCSPGTNTPHLYQMVCTGSIPNTNEGFEPVQMPVFPVVCPNQPCSYNLIHLCICWCRLYVTSDMAFVYSQQLAYLVVLL
jgi:hypothetical protein